jgi:hypothetical protein
MANKKIEVDVEVKGQNSVKGLGQEIRELTKQLRNTPEGTKEWSKIYNQIDDLKDKLEASKKASKDWIDTLQDAGGPLGVLGTGLNKVKVATQSFGGALKATGIGLIVGLLGGLVAAFRDNENAMKKLQPVMDGVQKILGGIFRAVEPLLDIFVDLAVDALPYVTKAIGGLYAAFSGLFSFIKTYALGVGKILKGIFTLDFDSLKEGISDLAGNFSKSWDAAKDTYGKFEEGTKEQTKIEKEEQEKRAKDAKEAAEKRKTQAEKELAQRKADLDAKIKLETDSETTSKDNLKKLLDQRLALELQTAGLTEAQKEVIRQDYKKKLDDALKADDDKKKADDAKKLQERSTQLDAEIQLEVDKENTSRETLAALLDEKMNIELQNVTLTEAQKELIRAKYAKQLEDAIKTDNEKQNALRQQNFDNELSAVELHYGDLKRFNEGYYDDLRALYDKNDSDLKSALDSGAISQDEYTKKIAASGKARRDIDKLEKQSAIEKTKLVADALGQLSTIVGQDTAAGKAFAIAKATIDTYQSAVAAYKSLAGIPVIGPALGAIAAAAAVAGGIATVQKIVAVQVPNAPSGGGGGGGASASSGAAPSSSSGPIAITGTKRAQGGMINGPGSGFSDSVPALLSNGEFVINSRSSKLFQPLLSAINDAGNLPQFAVGGQINSSSLSSTDNTSRIMDAIGQSISQQPIRTYVSSTDISNTQQFDRVIKSRSLI